MVLYLQYLVLYLLLVVNLLFHCFDVTKFSLRFKSYDLPLAYIYLVCQSVLFHQQCSYGHYII